MASEQKPDETPLAERISKPDPAPAGMNAATKSFTPGLSWADDVDTPTEEANADQSLDSATPATATASDEKKEPKTSQNDGATDALNGSALQEPEYDVTVQLSDMQADPNNPLYSASTFEQLNLDTNILNGLYHMNFRKPSKIQEKALPLLLRNPPSNLIGQSQSGTGKTAAFVLNILSRLDLNDPEIAASPQALVLAPSRELARQIIGVIKIMSSFMKDFDIYAAVPQDKPQKERIASPVVVGTPGTVFDLLKKRLFDTRHLKVLVLDEADNMLDQQGLGEQCLRVKQRLPPTAQIVLFSATFPDQVVLYAQKFAPGANQLTLRHDDLTVEGIKQVYLDCDSDEVKYDTLVRFYGLLTIGSSIIFVKTRKSADIIQNRMTAEGHKVVALTSNYEGSARDSVIDAFRDGTAKVLITTNVLARGIDVQSVSMVVNYDVPELFGPNGPTGRADCQTYLHRIGRTGRFGRVGVAVTFVGSRKEFGMLKEIKDYFQTDMTRLDAGNWDEVEEEVGRILKSARAGSNFKAA